MRHSARDRRARAWAAVALSFCAVTIAAQAPAQQQPPPDPQRPTFRTEANFVRVDVYPSKDDKPVHGLTAADFEVLEDGVAQKIETFEHVLINTGTPPDARVEPNSVREGERLAANPRNRVFVVFLDVPHVQVTSSHAIKEPLIRLFGRMMGPDDLIAVMTPDMSPTQITFGRKTEVIERGLRDNWPWGMRDSLRPHDKREELYEVCYPPMPGEGGSESLLAGVLKARRRERMVLEALHDLVVYLGGVREERKAIVLVTEGWRLYEPNHRVTQMRGNDRVPGVDPIGVGPDGRLRRDPPITRTDTLGSQSECDTDRMTLASMDNKRYFRDLLDDANRTNSSFYPIDPRGLAVFDDSGEPRGKWLPPDTSQRMLRDKIETLRTLADNTDGIAIVNDNNLDRGLKRVSDDLTSYYLLGYYSSSSKQDGGFRSIKVRVKAPGVAVRARRGYRAATAEEIRKATAAASIVVPEGEAAVATAVAELGRVRPDLPFVIRAVLPGSAAGAGSSGVWVAGELQSTRGAPTGGNVTIDVTAGTARAEATVALKPGERAFLAHVPLREPAAAVDVRARFVPAESPSIPMTSTTRTSVPAGLAAPLFYRRGLSTGNRLQPAAGIHFSRSERIRFEVPLGPHDKPGEGRVLDKMAKPLAIPVVVTERTDAGTGQRWLVADVTLAAFGAGDYAIELTASRGATSVKTLTAIRVTHP